MYFKHLSEISLSWLWEINLYRILGMEGMILWENLEVLINFINLASWPLIFSCSFCKALAEVCWLGWAVLLSDK